MEQRSYPRIVVYYRGSFRGETGAGHGLVVNMSLAGCAFKSERNLQVGDFLEVDLHLPGEDVPVKVDVAAVRWALDQEFGVEFIQISPEEQKRLRRFVRTPKVLRWVKNVISGGPKTRPF